MHATGVQLDDTFLVRQSTQADTRVLGIVFGTLHHAQRGVERVPAILQEGIRILDVVEAVVRRDDNWPLVGTGLRLVLLRGKFFALS